MITFKELSEAHKVGDKVVIKHGPKDVKGKTGRIGEIRKGLYKGAPKTITVDYDHNETTGQAKSVQLKSKHIQGVKEQVEDLQEKHRVSVTLSDPHHPAVTKRKELIQKTVRVKADNPGHAVDSAIHHFRRAGYKVHDHHYIGTVKEGAMPTFKELDEVSDNTAASYVHKRNLQYAKKAKPDSQGRVQPSDVYNSMSDKHKQGVNRALNRLMKPVSEGLGRGREDDEYHVPDPTTTTHKIVHTVSKDGGEKHNREVTISNTTKTREQAKAAARAHLEKQGYKIHEEAELEEGTFKYHMDKAVAAHDRGDTKRKEFHLANAKQARYSLKSTEISKHKDLLDKYKQMKEETLVEGAYEDAEENKKSADAAKKQGDMFAHHLHMADHHDNMAQWHSSKGRHGEADRHAEKSEKHHEEAMKHKDVKEDAAANNVGGGAIAGTQGDAGKKAVMTKKPLKRMVVQFKEFTEAKDPCWKNYKMVGMKDKDGKKVPNCVPEEKKIEEAAIDAKGHKSSTGGLTQKGVDAYNRENPGHHLQTAVTTPPSKLDPDSKAAKRRKSFCARMSGVDGPMKDEKGRPTRKALALRKWNC